MYFPISVVSLVPGDAATLFRDIKPKLRCSVHLCSFIGPLMFTIYG